MIAFLIRHWLAVTLLVGAGALALTWHMDRRAQYQLGVADTKAAFEQAIAKSTELIGHEKDAANRAASAAARRVCEQAGDISACTDL